jgi:hypothetical protein
MISRQEHNELIRKAGRERMKHIRDKYYNSGGKFYGDYGGIKEQLTNEEKDHIRKILKVRSRKSRRWTLIIFSLATLLFGFLCYMILLNLS